jgi:hypothetical protein
MKTTATRRPRVCLPRRPTFVRPRVEELEPRLPPDSLLNLGPADLGVSALPPGNPLTQDLWTARPPGHSPAVSVLGLDDQEAGQTRTSLGAAPATQAEVTPGTPVLAGAAGTAATPAPGGLDDQAQVLRRAAQLYQAAQAAAAAPDANVAPASSAPAVDRATGPSPAGGGATPAALPDPLRRAASTARQGAAHTNLAAQLRPEAVAPQAVTSYHLTKAPFQAHAVGLALSPLKQGAAPQPPAPVLYSTYLGGGSVTCARAVDATVAGDAYVAGVTQDPIQGVSDIYVALIPNANPRNVTEGALSLGGDNVEGVGIGLQDTGGHDTAVYVAGNDLDTGNGLVVRLSSDLTSISDEVMLPGVHLNGLSFGVGTNGVYVTGCMLNQGTGVNDILVAKLDPTNLMNLPPTGRETYTKVIPLTDGGAPVNNSGNAVEVDAAGNAYVAATFGNADGTDNRPLFLRLNPTGTAVDYMFAFQNPVPGLSGGMFGLEVQNDDPNGALFLTGSLENGHAHPDHNDMLLARVRAATGQIDQGMGDYAFRYIEENGNGDLSGRGIEVDEAGNAYVVGSINDGTNPADIDGYLLKVGPTGDRVLDFNDLGGSGVDRALAVELARDISNQGGFWVVGWTESSDFQPILNAYQPNLGAQRNGFATRFLDPDAHEGEYSGSGVVRMQNCLPAMDSQYVSRYDGLHQMFGHDHLVKSPHHHLFADCYNPDDPTPHTIDSTVDAEVSLNGGITFTHITVSAPVTVQVTNLRQVGNVGTYRGEITGFDIRLGDNVAIRQSPTRHTMGGTHITTMAGGRFGVQSYFDVFLELSADGGQNWMPSLIGAHLSAQDDQ